MEHVDWQYNKSILECNKYILQHEVNCDISFKVGEDQEVIKAHKFILSTRSAVFDRMFNGSFCESETDPVIPDVSPAAFRTLLRYCYYDCLDIEGDVALSVLYAATKYMLPMLEKAARTTLIENLDNSMIWDVCTYSTEVGDDELYTGFITYLKGNLSEINLLDVIKYAATTGHEELRAYCRKHFKENLSESNILDVTKYVVSIGDEELHTTCKGYLNRYISGANIWDIYKYALNEGDAEVLQDCQEYFEWDVEMAREVLQSEEFAKIQYEVLLDVLRINDKIDEVVGIEYTPGITISEIELFKACTAWAEAECLRQEIDLTGANRRTVLGECLSLIRFPTMLQKDLATVVYPTGILTQAEIVNLDQYIHKDTSAECQVDFPSRRRQFVVKPSGSASGGILKSTVFIESEVRVMLSRVWTWWPGSYTVTVRDESFRKSWSVILDTKHEKHLAGENNNYTLQYLDIEPQVLEADSRYAVTAECTEYSKFTHKLPGVNYKMVPGKLDPYKEVKITREPNTNSTIYGFTLSLV